MISVIHLQPPADAIEFATAAQAVLGVLAARPGFLRGQLGRAVDDAARWIMLTEWESVGAYRRGLGSYDVKILATPLMAFAVDQPSAFEALMVMDSAGAVVTAASDRYGDR